MSLSGAGSAPLRRTLCLGGRTQTDLLGARVPPNCARAHCGDCHGVTYADSARKSPNCASCALRSTAVYWTRPRRVTFSFIRGSSTPPCPYATTGCHGTHRPEDDPPREARRVPRAVPGEPTRIKPHKTVRCPRAFSEGGPLSMSKPAGRRSEGSGYLILHPSDPLRAYVRAAGGRSGPPLRRICTGMSWLPQRGGRSQERRALRGSRLQHRGAYDSAPSARRHIQSISVHQPTCLPRTRNFEVGYGRANEGCSCRQ